MTERELFEGYLFSTEKFKFRNKAFLFMLDENGEYEDQPVLEHWKTWQAATQRDGFKLVPVCTHEWSIQLSGRFVCDLCGDDMIGAADD